MPTLSIIFYFLVYSFLGWIMDTTCRTLEAHAFTIGSFFPVPLCPVYGFGVLLVIFLHSLFPSIPLVLQGVIYGIVLAALEYATGILVLAYFHRRLWTYAGGFLNLDGFTNFSHALTWGVLAVLLVEYLQPALEHLFKLNLG